MFRLFKKDPHKSLQKQYYKLMQENFLLSRKTANYLIRNILKRKLLSEK